MADMAFYREHFGLDSLKELLDFFLKSLKHTNRTPDSFVNFRRFPAKKEEAEYRDALHLLGSVRHASNPWQDLRRLLLEYPRIGEIIANMLGIYSEQVWTILRVDGHPQETLVAFRQSRFSKEEAEIIAHFAEQSGLLEYLTKVGSTWDYLLGFQAGMEKYAHREKDNELNRNLLSPYLDEASKGWELQYAFNVEPWEVIPRRGPSSRGVFSQEFDALISDDFKLMAVDVTFCKSGGMELDSIASDYQTRARDCKEAGLTFVWVTDGQGWNSSKGMLRQAIENIDYIFNFQLLERGALAKLCEEVLR